jgi:SpoVK/Ycf46/Vps4 family AAA+-type ATPase
MKAPRASFDDLKVPAEVMAQLKDIATSLRGWRSQGLLPPERRSKVAARGVAALFAGAAGIGKTQAAEAIAREVGAPLLVVDLTQVVSKYIGETEKNLSTVFAEAERSAAVLFFDEADALFGERTGVKDSRDRYANLDIDYLLQRMETFEGLTILASNLPPGLEAALSRHRIGPIVKFPPPA